MQQIYHSNAKTNIHIRSQIRSNTTDSIEEMAQHYNVSPQTVSKWRNRETQQDRSCAPLNINYSLTETESSLIVAVRKSTWLPLDEIWEMLLDLNPKVTRSSVYRCLVRNNINKVPETQKLKSKKFKEYSPGYLHIDVTYLPKFNGKSSYLFVAIDRATRAIYFRVYERKTAQSTVDFMDKVLDFYPFDITHILTDNGLEFTNRLYRSKKGNKAQKPSEMDVKCKINSIEHRLTKPSTPKTNGMVERVNGTIKNNTILKKSYGNKIEMENDLIAFMCYYNLFRRHGSLRRELNVKTPIQAVYKWFQLDPEIFKQNPKEFENKLLNLQQKINQLSSTTL